MDDKTIEDLKEAIEKGILKGIEKIGVENVNKIDWFSIKTQSETFSD